MRLVAAGQHEPRPDAFDDAPCSYSQAEIAAGIEIPYHEEITSALEGLPPLDADRGPCQQPDAAGLIVTYEYRRRWAAPLHLRRESLLAVVHHLHDRRELRSPDCLGRPQLGRAVEHRYPEAAPFPVGTYTVTATAMGSVDGAPNGASSSETFTLTATRTMTITPQVL